MSFLKRHWFNIFMTLFIFCSMGLTLLVALSPKQDAQNRGFIPCTTELANKVTSCQGGLKCTTKAILNNVVCDARVVTKGLDNWINDKQEKPWSNYLFEPELSAEEKLFREHTDIFYKENPNYHSDFEQLKRDYELLKEINRHG